MTTARRPLTITCGWCGADLTEMGPKEGHRCPESDERPHWQREENP